MTDIVEKLRAAIPDCNDIKWRLLSDAAIEIERLRAANVRLQEALAADPLDRFAENDELLEQVASLRAELAALRKDAARLDWIERHLFERKWDGTIGRKCDWYLVGNYRHVVQRMSGDTLRDAIDAALAKEGK